MSFKDRITIAAPAEQVWPYIADPVLMAGWNHKIVEVDRRAAGPVATGERFQLTYRMSRKPLPSQVLVVAARPSELLILEHVMRPERPDQVTREEYTLSQRAGRTTVAQRVDFWRSGLPWWALPIVWLIARFGRPVEQTHLEQLRDLVEADIQRATPA